MEDKADDSSVSTTGSRNTKMANLTENGNATSSLNQTTGFATILPAGRGVFWLFLFAISVFLSFTAFLGNALILIALRKVSSLHLPSKLLFGCLAVTDLGVGLISQPLFTTFILGFATELNLNIYFFTSTIFYASSIVFCEVSVFTSTAISVDRLLALLLGLRYRHFVTLRRVTAVICCFWLIAVSVLFIHLFLSFWIALPAALSLVILSLVISVFSYTKIFLTLRQQQAQVQAHVQGQPNIGGMPLNTARYKKTVSNIAWVQFALVACYVPFAISALIGNAIGYSNNTVDAFNSTPTLVYLNSSLNPLLYCWRIGEVRQAVKATTRQFCCCLS